MRISLCLLWFVSLSGLACGSIKEADEFSPFYTQSQSAGVSAINVYIPAKAKNGNATSATILLGEFDDYYFSVNTNVYDASAEYGFIELAEAHVVSFQIKPENFQDVFLHVYYSTPQPADGSLNFCRLMRLYKLSDLPEQHL